MIPLYCKQSTTEREISKSNRVTTIMCSSNSSCHIRTANTLTKWNRQLLTLPNMYTRIKPIVGKLG